MRTTAAVALALVLFAGPAWAISVQEVIDLSQAQVGDDIIVAKIKSDRSTFTLGAKDILDLKNAGVSDKVILAMVDAERPAASASSPAPSGLSNYGSPRPAQAPPTTYDRPPQTTYEVVVPVYRTVYYPTYTYYSGGCGSYYPVGYSGGCGSYGYYPYRSYYGGYYPSWGFSYGHYGRHHAWGVHFGW